MNGMERTGKRLESRARPMQASSDCRCRARTARSWPDTGCWVRLLASFVLASSLGCGLCRPAFAASVTISEVLYDAVGPDAGQVFVELYAPGGTSLEGFILEGVNGADGRVGPVVELSGRVPEDGFFVIADLKGGTTSVALADLLREFDLQNGPDSLVLRGPQGDVVDALGYGVFGPGETFAGEGRPAADPPSGHSVARHFANVDTDDNATDFGSLSSPTPGFGPILVPEPGTGWLLASALTGLLVAHRRRARACHRSGGLR